MGQNLEGRDPEGVAYHARIPAELEKLCLEMFHFRDADFGSRSLVVARGLEALVILFDTIRKMRKNRELNGLHEDDFSRLQRIKNHILGHLDERISLEKQASDLHTHGWMRHTGGSKAANTQSWR